MVIRLLDLERSLWFRGSGFGGERKNHMEIYMEHKIGTGGSWGHVMQWGF